MVAEAQPQQADAALEMSRRVRWLFKRLFSSLTTGPVDEYALDKFNEVLADSLRHLRVAVGVAERLRDAERAGRGAGSENGLNPRCGRWSGRLRSC
jgi:hypothetical protein